MTLTCLLPPLNRRGVRLENRGSPFPCGLREEIQQLDELGLPRMRGRKGNQQLSMHLISGGDKGRASEFSLCRNIHPCARVFIILS